MIKTIILKGLDRHQKPLNGTMLNMEIKCQHNFTMNKLDLYSNSKCVDLQNRTDIPTFAMLHECYPIQSRIFGNTSFFPTCQDNALTLVMYNNESACNLERNLSYPWNASFGFYRVPSNYACRELSINLDNPVYIKQECQGHKLVDSPPSSSMRQSIILLLLTVILSQ
jgi:hypothetical protein